MNPFSIDDQEWKIQDGSLADILDVGLHSKMIGHLTQPGHLTK
jgi:hypothetical protein